MKPEYQFCQLRAYSLSHWQHVEGQMQRGHQQRQQPSHCAQQAATRESAQQEASDNSPITNIRQQDHQQLGALNEAADNRLIVTMLQGGKTPIKRAHRQQTATRAPTLGRSELGTTTWSSSQSHSEGRRSSKVHSTVNRRQQSQQQGRPKTRPNNRVIATGSPAIAKKFGALQGKRQTKGQW